MEKIQNYIKELNALQKRIFKSRDDVNRSRLVSDYVQLASYINDLANVSNVEFDYHKYLTEIYDFYDKYDMRYQKENVNHINDSINSRGYLMGMTDFLLETFNKYPINPIYDHKDVNNTIGREKLIDLVKTTDLTKKSYNNMVDRIQTVRTLDGADYAGYCSPISYTSSPVILAGPSNKYSSAYGILAHELGHAYDFQTRPTQIKYNNTANLLIETPSILFEQMYTNKYYDFKHDDIAHALEVRLADSMRILTLTQDLLSILFKENKTCSMDTNGTFYIDFNEFKKDYNECLLDYDESVLRPSIYNYAYLVGYIISNMFLKAYQGDNEAMLKEFNQFMMQADDMSVSEIIEFMDLGPTEEKIKSLYYTQQAKLRK